MIDHGGDGLSFYELDSTELTFRLWESKRHEADSSSVTTTVTGAAEQLKSHGPEYLARISKPLQTHRDERVQLLAGQLVRLWKSGDERCAVGVSVGTSKTTSLPRRPFSGLHTHFP